MVHTFSQNWESSARLRRENAEREKQDGSASAGLKLIIAGSRSLNPTIAQISRLITELPSLVICGCADGVDKAGCAWARHFSVPVEFFPAWPA